MPITVVRRDFESEFFGIEIGRVEIPDSAAPEHVATEMQAIIASGRFKVIEANIGLPRLSFLAPFEDLGFRTVDSRISFLTRIGRTDERYHFATEPPYAVRRFREPDLQRVIELTHLTLTDNDSFVSRYKDEQTFGPRSAARWFEAWITDVVGRETSHTAIATLDEEIVGFFSFAAAGMFEDDPVFKGILVAVEPEMRGAKLHLAMQAHLFQDFGSDHFWVDNTTQLSNYAVIKNHIRSQRTLDGCELSLMWRAGSFSPT